MFVSKDLECVVCFYKYTRRDRVPRVLHCNHTFCTPCLKKLSKLEGFICTLCCPLCRWITCTQANLTLTGSLYVNIEIWDLISQEQQETQNESVEDLQIINTQQMKSKRCATRHSGFMSTLHKMFSCVLPKRLVMVSC